MATKTQEMVANNHYKKCTYRHGDNHTKENYFKIHGYPPNFKSYKRRGKLPKSNFGQLPKAMNIQTDNNDNNSYCSSYDMKTNKQENYISPLERMQSQLNQMNNMMSFLM